MGVQFIGKSSFDAVYEANADKVYRTALHYSENHHVAEEITQSVFMQLYMNMENINMDAVPVWLCTCAKHMALNYHRGKQFEVYAEDVKDEFEIEAKSESTEDEYIKVMEQNIRYEFLEEMLRDLYAENERWYYAWTITRILDKPEKEVAEIMGISYDALRKMLSRTNKWMERHYRERYNHMKKV